MPCAWLHGGCVPRVQGACGAPRTCGVHVDGSVDGGGGQQVGLGGVERDPRQGVGVGGAWVGGSIVVYGRSYGLL